MGGAAARGLPTLTEQVLATQTGIGGVLATAATTFKPPANSNVPTTALYICPGASLSTFDVASLKLRRLLLKERVFKYSCSTMLTTDWSVVIIVLVIAFGS